jgi:hypothetical protein
MTDPAQVIPIDRRGGRPRGVYYAARTRDAMDFIVASLSTAESPGELARLLAVLDILRGGEKPNHLARAHGSEVLK